jgi:SAM-dependent methyltransferase
MVTDLLSEPYQLNPHTGCYEPTSPAIVRASGFEEEGFFTLLSMQERHFWYVGRHRFLHHATFSSIRRYCARQQGLRAVDLGGGCGGWVRYLRDRSRGQFAELALADASGRALELAAPVVGPQVARYRIDLLDLGWENRWDVAFLFDVLEHIPADEEVLRQIGRCLRPGGLLFVACPALQLFWSYNDVLSHHCRRYTKERFRKLAEACHLELCRTRYFMFFLSPLLWLSRLRGPDLSRLSPEEVRQLLDRSHRIPAAPLNGALTLMFSAETPLGWYFPFPWGTSILGVFRRPLDVPSRVGESPRTSRK